MDSRIPRILDSGRDRRSGVRLMADRFDFVVVANRLPVDRRDEPDGSVTWLPSPGGLVAAWEPAPGGHGGAWDGCAGSGREAPPPFDASEMHLVAVPLSAREVA